MRRVILSLALAGMAGSAAAGSGSVTLTLASDYLFDGVSQTQGDDRDDFNPALQASFDFAAENGFYAGIWGSNVDFGDGDPADIEVDLYAGFARTLESGWGWDFGVLRYTYTGAPSSYDYTEYMAAVTFPFGTTAKLYLADDDALGGNANRFKLLHSFALAEGWSLDLEATRTSYSNGAFEDFTHGQIGVSHSLGAFDAYLGYSDTSRDDPLADGRLLFTLSTSLDVF
ncbi:MAG: hypothetical protein KatS3mg126_1646 [Lysobacteraceae bacterium]|nr:MAG: hypothetical protein KatS3mg126_1646 [Xanthomonadaceae bacterium]